MSSFVTEPFGDLPTDWKYAQVGANIEFATGPAFDSTQFNDDGLGHKLVRGINLTRGITRWGNSNTKYWSNVAEEHKKYELEIGDVVIGMDGSLVGKNYAQISAKDLPALLVQRVARLRCKETLDQRFLYYMFGNDAWISYVEIVKTNSGIPHISNGDIKEFSIPFPHKVEQQKIAAILTAVDEVIETTQVQINKLKDLKIGLMQELLTQGIGHTEFKDSPVGRIPKAWEIVELERLCTWMGVGIATSTTHAYTDDGIPLLRNQNILVGTIDKSDILRITKEFSEENHSKKIKTGDVITIRTGYPGKSAVVTAEFNDCHTFTTLISRPNGCLIDSDFLALIINSDYGMSFVAGGQAGGAQQNLNVSVLKTFPVKLPDLVEQRKIFRLVSSIAQKIDLAEAKQNKFIKTKKALMQDLLTGKVRVKTE